MSTFKIAHRGFSSIATENTLLAFQKALNYGVDAIELDVHLTLDNEIIVFHDEDLNRLTNGFGKVCALSLENLQKLKINNYHKIPTLIEVLDLINKQCVVNIELKGNGTPKLVSKLIEHYIQEKNWAIKQFLVSSFNTDMLLEMRSLNPNIPLGIITDRDLEHALDFSKYLKIEYIIANFELLNKDKVARIQNLGYKILAWTVNETADIKIVKNFNVHGIISDYVDRI